MVNFRLAQERLERNRELEAEVERLEAAIRYHREQHKHSGFCCAFDTGLYAALHPDEKKEN